MLATGGLDGAIHLWDVRSHQSPCQSFSAGAQRPVNLVRKAVFVFEAGAGGCSYLIYPVAHPSLHARAHPQLAWNRLSPSALASAHGQEVWLWDTRRAGGGASSGGSGEGGREADTLPPGAMGCFECGSSGGGSSNNKDKGEGEGCLIQSFGWNPTRTSELVTSTYVHVLSLSLSLVSAFLVTQPGPPHCITHTQ